MLTHIALNGIDKAARLEHVRAVSTWVRGIRCSLTIVIAGIQLRTLTALDIYLNEVITAPVNLLKFSSIRT